MGQLVQPPTASVLVDSLGTEEQSEVLSRWLVVADQSFADEKQVDMLLYFVVVA
jgi:regulator of sirC expression with transglutaminase-like and TPR domain